MVTPSSDTLLAACMHLTEGERSDVQEAYQFAVTSHAGQERDDGSPYVLHVIEVATIVADWGADRDTVVAALLHDVLEDTPVKKEELLERFGKHVGLLVEGITKFTEADLNPALDLERKTETLRKLFDVMRMDIRSIVIKLADRLHNIQTIDSFSPERRERFARETMNVYYKIAFHLGMRQLRREYAERCVPYVYEDGMTDARERDQLCQEFQSLPHTIERVLKAQESESSGIEKIFLQPRNLQIFHDKRVARDRTSLSQDAFSLVAIVIDEEHCYHFLKSIHTLYRPVAGQFRDFIAAPSDAGYQSLHTHVSLPDGQVVEIRIYTPEMYRHAMMGIAQSLFGHGAVSPGFEWLQRTQDLDVRTRESSSAFWEALESDILRETISVTIDRKRLSLPKGSTALDAAFALHEEAAVRALRIAVNGIESSFSHVLREEDDVHVTLDTIHHMTFEWLDAVSTKHARFLISEQLQQHSRAEKIALGSKILQRELDHYGKGLIQHLSRTQCQAAAAKYRRHSFDQVLAMIGEGVLRPRDLVFFLFPEEERSRFFRRSSQGDYRFRILVTFSRKERDVLATVSSFASSHDITIDTMSQEKGPETVTLHIVGHTGTRIQFADFVESLERSEYCQGVQTLIPMTKKSILVGSFLLAFFVLVIDIVLLPWYQDVLKPLPQFARFALQAAPFVPILVANWYLLRLMREYFVRMRSERWFLVIGFLLNLISLGILTFEMVAHGFETSVLPLVAIFTASLLIIGYRFLKTEMLFAPFDEQQLHQLSADEWAMRRRKKLAGYAIRLGAVIIWGIEPIIIRYSPANDLEPFLRAFLFSLGLLIPTILLYCLQAFVRTRSLPSFRLPYSGTFFMIALGRVAFLYFYNASLLYTTGTNLILFNNFAPLLALMIAACLWRKRIPYLRQPGVMLTVFLLAVMAGVGSSLLVVNSVYEHSAGAVLGDVLAVLAMFADVILVTGQIEYIKQFSKTNALLLSTHVYSFVLLFVAPIIIVRTLLNPDFLVGLTDWSLLVSLGIGALLAVGQFLNYEAFRRIDGYLAFMMFNISVMITFMSEAFLLHTVEPTLILVLSGAMIIGASIAAELVNSRCEKKGI